MMEIDFEVLLPRQRPRASLKEKLLLELNLARRDHLLACGELIQLGSCHWRWRILELGSSEK